MGRRLTSSAVPADALARDPERIEGMFSAIVPRYDLMNRLMTAGLDRRWRRLAAGEAGPLPGDEALDACCGTGDLTFALLRSCPDCSVTGGTSLRRCLRGRGRRRQGRERRAGGRLDFVGADLLALPFADDRFAAATVGFGVRNVSDPGAAFVELRRVVRPGGHVVCLESTPAPDGLGNRFHALWSDRVVPALGRLVRRLRRRLQLPAGVGRHFRDADGLAGLMGGAGLTNVRYRRLGFGAVSLHVGVVRRERQTVADVALRRAEAAPRRAASSCRRATRVRWRQTTPAGSETPAARR